MEFKLIEVAERIRTLREIMEFSEEEMAEKTNNKTITLHNKNNKKFDQLCFKITDSSKNKGGAPLLCNLKQICVIIYCFVSDSLAFMVS